MGCPKRTDVVSEDDEAAIPVSLELRRGVGNFGHDTGRTFLDGERATERQKSRINYCKALPSRLPVATMSWLLKSSIWQGKPSLLFKEYDKVFRGELERAQTHPTKMYRTLRRPACNYSLIFRNMDATYLRLVLKLGISLPSAPYGNAWLLLIGKIPLIFISLPVVIWKYHHKGTFFFFLGRPTDETLLSERFCNGYNLRESL